MAQAEPFLYNMPPANNNQWWKPAFEIFGQVSAWVAVPIVIALVTGKWLDGRYGTKPWLFLGFSAAAFLISSFGIVRTVTVYMNQIKNDDSNKTK